MSARHNYVLQFVETLQKFQRNDYLCDTVIIAADGRLRAHSVILAASSPVLQLLLKTHYKPREHVIEIQDVDIVVLQVAVSYMYTGELNLSSINDSSEYVNRLSSLFKYLEVDLPAEMYVIFLHEQNLIYGRCFSYHRICYISAFSRYITGTHVYTVYDYS